MAERQYVLLAYRGLEALGQKPERLDGFRNPDGIVANLGDSSEYRPGPGHMVAFRSPAIIECRENVGLALESMQQVYPDQNAIITGIRFNITTRSLDGSMACLSVAPIHPREGIGPGTIIRTGTNTWTAPVSDMRLGSDESLWHHEQWSPQDIRRIGFRIQADRIDAEPDGLVRNQDWLAIGYVGMQVFYEVPEGPRAALPIPCETVSNAIGIPEGFAEAEGWYAGPVWPRRAHSLYEGPPEGALLFWPRLLWPLGDQDETRFELIIQPEPDWNVIEADGNYTPGLIPAGSAPTRPLSFDAGPDGIATAFGEMFPRAKPCVIRRMGNFTLASWSIPLNYPARNDRFYLNGRIVLLRVTDGARATLYFNHILIQLRPDTSWEKPVKTEAI